MIEEILKTGGTVAFGLLIGLGFMSWVAPDTAGGQAMIVIICTLVIIAVVSFIRFFAKRRRR